MKDFNIAKYLKENKLGPHAILGGYVDLHNLKEEEEMELDTEIPYEGPERKVDGFGDKFKQTNAVEEAEGGSFNVSLMYADYPSISNAEQRLATMHLKKLVKSLGGIATITNDAFDTVDFNVTGISSFEELQNAYNDVVENEDDDYTMLPSWDLEPKENSPVQEDAAPPFGMPDKSKENPWMDEVDGTDDYKEGNWTCYYDYPGVLAWSYKDIPLSKLAVYATPDWNGDGTTPIQIDIDEKSQDQMTLKQSEFADFNEYAKAMKPYLDRIEDLESNWGSLAPSNDSMDTDDSVNPFPSIMKEKEDSMMFDKGWQYDDEEVSNDDRFADLGGDQIKSAIKSLMDDGFDTREIAQFVVDTIRGFKSFKEEVTVSSSGVQMEKK
jgi:hypothetical protein